MQQNPSSSFAQESTMPEEFPEILKDFARECLRHQPDKIEEFGVKFFQSKLAQVAKIAASGLSKDELTLDEIENVINTLFSNYDEDRNGYLDRTEFRNLLNDLRSKLPFISEDDLLYFMAEADANQNNKIEYNEFIPIALQIIQTMYARKRYQDAQDDVAKQAKNILVHGMKREELETVLQNIFTSFDTDGSGSLSREEFTEALRSMDLGLTRKEINSVLFQYDRNEDGHISYKEFVPFAFDLLSKLTEMRIFETYMAEDQLAMFLKELFLSNEENSSNSMIAFENAKELIMNANIGLTALQIANVMSVAEVNDEGCFSYVQFIPKAVTVIRSMLNFESDLVNQVEAREGAN